MLILHVNDKEIMRMSEAHLRFHRPTRNGDRSWKIIDDGTNEVIDSYTPSRPEKSKPITPYKGSWAEDMEKRRLGIKTSS
jgi:hypothetical protein